MTDLRIPAESDLARALREPALLAPGFKPPSPVKIDWENPLTRGLRSFWIPEFGVDLASGRVPTVNGVPDHVGTGDGLALYLNNASSHYVDFGSYPSDSAFTIGVVSKALSVNAFFACSRSGSTSNGIDFLVNSSGTGVSLRVGTTASNTNTPIWSFDLDEYQHITGGWTSGGKSSLYVGGSLATQSASAFSGTIPHTQNMRLSSRGTLYLSQRIKLFYYFDRELTAAEIAEFSRNLYQVLRPANDVSVRIGVPAGGGGTLITAATETDTAIAVGKAKSSAVSAAVESDGAQPVARSKRKLIGVASETESALQLSATKRKAISVATETDTAVPVTVPTPAIGIASETDAAVAVGKSKRKAINPATDIEAAQALGKAKSAAIQSAAETDASQAVARSKAKSVGVATETDGALSVAIGGQTFIGVAQETDIAVPIGRVKRKAINPVVETDIAMPIGATKARAITPALETDTPIIFARSKAKAIMPAGEVDTALSFPHEQVDCTAPPTYTLFDDARNLLHAAVLRQFGEEVIFSSKSLTVTSIFRRVPDAIPAAGSRPGVPRDELRIKETDICAHGIDQGEPVTVRGVSYKVVSVERTKHGMTRLGIRRER